MLYTQSASTVLSDCLVSLVVKTSALRVADLGSNPAWAVDLFPGRVMPVSDKIVTPRATQPGTLHYMVSAGTGLPSVSIL